MKSRIGISLVAMMALVGANTAQANAIITWGSPTYVDFGNTAQILGTAGGYTYVEAVTAYKTADLMVNGVNFLHLDTVGASASYAGAVHITQTLSGARTDSGWTILGTSPLDNDYSRALVSTTYLSTAGDGAITLAGLNNGTSYRVQLWTGWWDNDVYATKYDGKSLNPGSTIPRGYGGPTDPTPPQFMVGTFTANDVSQTIAMTAVSPDAPYYNIRMYAGAISLFEAGGQPVPEPGTWLLLGGSLLGLCVGGFKRIRSRLNV